MKKIFTIFAALTLSVGLWAEAPANVESVDLGLPSGLKWATFNVGATAPEGNGDYFAWGETEPYYSSQDPLTWKTGKENGYKWQSYCGSSSFTEWSTAPYDATTKILKSEFDAATANWGSDWRMPTKAEQDELRTECTWTWTEDYNGTGIKGYIVTSNAEGNNNSIFFPASGYRRDLSLFNVGSYGRYWSSSLDEDNSDGAYFLDFDSDYEGWFATYRFYGKSVRPVYVPAPAPKVGDQFVDTTSVLKFEVTAVGDTNTVKVIKNNYTGTSYTVPDTVKYNDVTFAVTEIGMEAFSDCSSLESINLSNVTTIGEGAFAFSGLTSITIPTSVTSIGECAFYNCSSLQSVTLSEGLLTIGESAFEKCSSLESVTIPESVTTIGKGAFEECSSLESINLSNVTTIGEGAFAFSGLTSITIPTSVTEIQMGAFYECAGLASVTFEGNACQGAIGDLAFYEVGKDAPALLTLHGTWAKENQPDEDGNWYGGKFELAGDPTTLPQTRAAVKATKVMTNSQVIFRAENKNFSVLGQEVK